TRSNTASRNCGMTSMVTLSGMRDLRLVLGAKGDCTACGGEAEVSGDLDVDAGRQHRFAHEVAVDAAGGVAALGDRPDDERLATTHVARGEDAGDARHFVAVGLHVATGVQLHA